VEGGIKTKRPFVVRARPLISERLGEEPKPNENIRVDIAIERHRLSTSSTFEISQSDKRKIWRE
jgi:hypothetical protein